jgi:hypothetical protein
MEKINLDKILSDVGYIGPRDDDKELNNMPMSLIKELMKETAKKALQLAADNATATAHEDSSDYGTGKIWATIDKQSILSIEKLIE